MPDQKLSSLKIGTTWSLPPGWTRLGCGCHRETVQSSQSLPWSQRDSVDDVLGKKLTVLSFQSSFHLVPLSIFSLAHKRTTTVTVASALSHSAFKHVSWYIFQSHHFIPWSSKWLIASLYLPRYLGTCALHGRLDCKASTLEMDLYMKFTNIYVTSWQLQPQDKFERTPHLISAAVRLVSG